MENLLLCYLLAFNATFVKWHGAPLHWNIFVRERLNVEVKDRWIGGNGRGDKALFSWPPRTPGIIPCDLFF